MLIRNFSSTIILLRVWYTAYRFINRDWSKSEWLILRDFFLVHCNGGLQMRNLRIILRVKLLNQLKIIGQGELGKNFRKYIEILGNRKCYQNISRRKQSHCRGSWCMSCCRGFKWFMWERCKENCLCCVWRRDR